MKRLLLVLLPLLLSTLACQATLESPATATAPQRTPVLSPTSPPEPTTAPSPTSQPEPTAAPSPTTPPPLPTPTQVRPNLIAYASGGMLLITDVTGGVKGTTQYTPAGAEAPLNSLAWSPSGAFIAYSAWDASPQQILDVYAVGAGTSVHLGPGALPAWSPDSTQLAFVRDDNLWVTAVENPQPRQITFQTDWAWGNPAFTPDGGAVMAAGSARADLGAQGNTQFYLYRMPLEGGDGLTPLPGMSQAICCSRLPYDLRFAPDGQRLAFSTSYHLDVCAAPFAVYLGAADGSALAPFTFPSIEAALDPSKDYYTWGYSFAWNPQSDALALTGAVMNCMLGSGDEGKFVAGPQLSIVGLKGDERMTVPGEFLSASFDHTNTMLAAALATADAPPRVVIYSLAGELLLDLGEGDWPQFQP